MKTATTDVRQGDRLDHERARETDDLLDGALAALGRAGTEPGVALTSDELIGRLERAKRNRETVLGRPRGDAPPASPG